MYGNEMEITNINPKRKQKHDMQKSKKCRAGEKGDVLLVTMCLRTEKDLDKNKTKILISLLLPERTHSNTHAPTNNPHT